MSKDGYLPPGVTESMIPGDRPEDVEWEWMVDELWDEANDFVSAAHNLIQQSEHFSYGDISELLRAAMGAVL